MSRPSYEVTKRYKDKAIRRVAVDVPREMYERWEAALKADNITKASFIKTAINEYLKTVAE